MKLLDWITQGIDTEASAPTWQSLCDWLRHCPKEAKADTAERVAKVYGGKPTSHFLYNFDRPEGATLLALFEIPMPKTERPWLRAITMDQLHGDWLKVAGENPAPHHHPIAPLVLAWLNRPPVARLSTHTQQIFPNMRITEAESRKAITNSLAMFEHGEGNSNQANLFPVANRENGKCVPLLDLADASGHTVMAKGQGAPLPLRLLVRLAMLVDPRDRQAGKRIEVAPKVCQLLGAMYKKPNNCRDWPKVKVGLQLIDIHYIRLPGGRWYLLKLRYLPEPDLRGRLNTEDRVILEAAFPPGSKSGPEIDLATLDRLGRTSAPRYRAWLAAQSLTSDPGRSRRPVKRGKAKGKVWVPSKNLNDYPILTEADQRRLAFGMDDSAHRTRADLLAPWLDLPDFEVLLDQHNPATAQHGIRLLPKPGRKISTAKLSQPRK